jgi:DNA-binding response OmpR family regulator
VRGTDTLILVVDDDEDIREILTVFLEADGYRVKTACDGLDAWKEMEADPPALIILDWMMPHMDGEQFLKKLRARRTQLAGTPVILLSGNEAAREKAAAFNVPKCLKKPVEYDELLSAISAMLSPAAGKDVA